MAAKEGPKVLLHMPNRTQLSYLFQLISSSAVNPSPPCMFSAVSRARTVHYWNEDPIIGCQIGTSCPILHFFSCVSSPHRFERAALFLVARFC
jgi:hypothetical protein